MWKMYNIFSNMNGFENRGNKRIDLQYSFGFWAPSLYVPIDHGLSKRLCFCANGAVGLAWISTQHGALLRTTLRPLLWWGWGPSGRQVRPEPFWRLCYRERPAHSSGKSMKLSWNKNTKVSPTTIRREEVELLLLGC